MADTVPPFKEVAVVFTTAFAAGIYVTSSTFCYRWLLFADEGWSLRKRVNWMIVSATTVIFLLNLVYPVVSLRRVMEMVKLLNDQPGVHYVTSPWDRILRCTAANVTALIADCILIYRCWVVYERRSLIVIVFPVILWLGCLACTVLEVYFEIAHDKNPETNPQAWRGVNESIGPAFALIPFLALTVLLNCYSTFMLTRRINTIATKGESPTGRQLRYIARVFAESGILYLSITVALLAAWFTPNNIAIQILSLINIPVIGLAFNLVVIRSAQLKAGRNDSLEGQVSEDEVSEIQYRHPTTIASV
ncbi:hypothetical protein NP233_g9171 [Leucocoprinus birnbaumii]|uniref:Uncharacterized protein n=1 Tax=Leucocoprinus birnbaumii TaxID=56174 RepID=A0AAD5VKV5_9AGAR|nr:hypothetical protein NP233_g9171 [Leucocoprinus birnbaumii]